MAHEDTMKCEDAAGQGKTWEDMGGHGRTWEDMGGRGWTQEDVMMPRLPVAEAPQGEAAVGQLHALPPQSPGTHKTSRNRTGRLRTYAEGHGAQRLCLDRV